MICHERKAITATVRATVMRLETIEESVSVKACWAPSTSLFNREMSAPVWVREKKASGISWMWPKTFSRMS